eukprot:scaffold68018_cov68-Phaeocystis_antarctica.AAC.4
MGVAAVALSGSSRGSRRAHGSDCIADQRSAMRRARCHWSWVSTWCVTICRSSMAATRHNRLSLRLRA